MFYIILIYYTKKQINKQFYCLAGKLWFKQFVKVFALNMLKTNGSSFTIKIVPLLNIGENRIHLQIGLLVVLRERQILS